MADATAKPVIFISYSHKDEPEQPRDGEIQWLSFVRTYLQPAIKHGIFDLFVDENLPGGANLKPEIERKLRACDVFVLLISANSTASDYIIDTEIKITREREAKGEDVVFYPLLLTPTPKVALDKFKDKVVRPRDARPLSGFPYSERIQQMSDIADEIAKIARDIVSRKPGPPPRAPQPAYVHITGLPETAYERLVGREAELKRLDEAWADAKTNILSLVAEGGAGKSALVNEWLRRLQADNYHGAEAVLGWSFYSQGTKERATSADEFLNWALDRLGITLATTSASAKAEAIAEAMMRRRVLLLLDGVEPLQHGPGPQLGQLKDFGLRALLRRFAATPPEAAHGLVVLTSRLAVKDIAHWHDGAAPVRNIEHLSDEAGAALLRDNGVWGTDKELKAAAHDFGGHPLALGLLASFLKETQTSDVRRRDHIRNLLADAENPGHDHARRVMESYEKEWLVGQPVPLAIMHMVGLFDRPASGDCLKALCRKPAIEGLTDQIVKLDEGEWQRAIARLREVRLLAPPDPAAAGALDAHPLVREWFGERLKQTNEAAWKAAHGRLYEHLRDTTKEGKTPKLEDLAPLYQAIAHGCRAGRHQEVLQRIYINRICRRLPSGDAAFDAVIRLGATDTELAAISWFFERPFEKPVSTLNAQQRSWVLGASGSILSAVGRILEAIPALRLALSVEGANENQIEIPSWISELSEIELAIGNISTARELAAKALESHSSRDKTKMLVSLMVQSRAFNAAGELDTVERLLIRAQKIETQLRRSGSSLRHHIAGGAVDTLFGELDLARGNLIRARDRATRVLRVGLPIPVITGLNQLNLARARFGLGLLDANRSKTILSGQEDVLAARSRLDDCVAHLRAAGIHHHIPRSLLARSAFRRSLGNWDGAARDLDEVEEIAEPGPMRLHLCDMALERARLSFARIEAFAPLHGLIDDSPPKAERPSEGERKNLHDEAAKQLAIADDYIKTCGYHRRDEELAELQAVLAEKRTFASLPPRV
jgi:AAA ATPase domain/TIR domain